MSSRTIRAASVLTWLGALACASPPPAAEPAAAETPQVTQDCDPEPSREKVSAAFAAIAADVEACTPTRTKVLRVAATFRNDGTVTLVEVIGPSGEPRRYPTRGVVMNLASEQREHDDSVAGTPAASCIEEVVRTARIGPFCDVSLLAIFPFAPPG